jgi:predicted DNA-binding protein with PD1-like motif
MTLLSWLAVTAELRREPARHAPGSGSAEGWSRSPGRVESRRHVGCTGLLAVRVRDRGTRLAFAVGGAIVGAVVAVALPTARSNASSSGAPEHPSPMKGSANPRPEPIVPPGVRAKLVGEDAGARTYELVLAPGTEAMGAIAQFVEANHFEAAHFQGLGACTDAILAYWDPAIRDYRRTRYRQQMEIVSIVGDAAPTPGDAAGLHVHMAVGFADGTLHGGHLFETHVSPTMELVVTVSPVAVRRRYDESFRAWLLRP